MNMICYGHYYTNYEEKIEKNTDINIEYPRTNHTLKPLEEFIDLLDHPILQF